MDESILNDVKKILGIASDYTAFDTDLIIHINSVFNTLSQLGVEDGVLFSISDDTAVWSDYTSETKYNNIKSYVSLKVRLMFDPPSSGTHTDCMKQLIDELEWRILITADAEESEE